MSDWGTFSWVEGIESWRRQITAELAALPETLRLFREGIDNFQRVTKRLLDATEGIEEFTQLYAGAITDGRHRIEEARNAIREQMASAPADPVGTAVAEVAKALSIMSELNPLWSHDAGHGHRPLPPSTGPETPPPRAAPRKRAPRPKKPPKS
jgi:hypothetical protein